MIAIIKTGIKEVMADLLLGVYIVFVILMLLILSGNAQAKVVQYGSAAEQVRIKYGEETVFRFQKPVQTITGAGRFNIKPANAVNPSYATLSVNPRFTNGKNEVTFFLTDSSVVKAQIIVSPNDPAADSFYDFKSHGSDDSESENAPPISEIELLKAMIRDDSVSGYKVIRTTEIVSSKLSNVNIELVRIYKGTPFNGYVFKLTNSSWTKNVQLDVRHVTVGNPNLAILSQSDETVLLPKGKGAFQTLLRVVSKNTSSSRDVIFAMEAQDQPPQPSNH